MAHVSRASKRPEIIHRKKLFGGRETAQDVHRKLAWAGGRCYLCCGVDIVAKFEYFQSPKDLMKYEPGIASDIVSRSDNGQLPVWQSKYGPLVRFWSEYACRTHLKYVEIQAARLPSRIHVEIDRGVGEDKIIVQVPLGSVA